MEKRSAKQLRSELLSVLVWRSYCGHLLTAADHSKTVTQFMNIEKLRAHFMKLPSSHWKFRLAGGARAEFGDIQLRYASWYSILRQFVKFRLHKLSYDCEVNVKLEIPKFEISEFGILSISKQRKKRASRARQKGLQSNWGLMLLSVPVWRSSCVHLLTAADRSKTPEVNIQCKISAKMKWTILRNILECACAYVWQPVISNRIRHALFLCTLCAFKNYHLYLTRSNIHVPSCC